MRRAHDGAPQIPLFAANEQMTGRSKQGLKSMRKSQQMIETRRACLGLQWSLPNGDD
jgi:hypothetical protein